jgi:hypothetical protein
MKLSSLSCAFLVLFIESKSFFFSFGAADKKAEKMECFAAQFRGMFLG